MRLELAGIIYKGCEVEDDEILGRLPGSLQRVLRKMNGFLAFDGAFHLRGACREPTWHSLRHAWEGPAAFHALYQEVTPEDVPFAQNALGDQYLVRGKEVVRLDGETGELEPLGETPSRFLEAVCAEPFEFLNVEPLLQFFEEGGRIEPGQLLSAAPPFCFEESSGGVSLRAIAAEDRLGFLARLASRIHDLKDGESIEIETLE